MCYSSPKIFISNQEWCVLFLPCTCCINNPPCMVMSFSNRSTIILIVYNLQEGSSCHAAFKPSFIYKCLPPQTVGLSLFKFMSNLQK